MDKINSFEVEKIFLNGRFLSQTITGVQRYALELIQGIDRHLGYSPALQQRLTFTLLVPANVHRIPSFNNISVKQVGKLAGQLWEQLELPFYSRTGFLVGFCNTAPLLKRNQMVTLCDASVYKVPEAYSFLFRLWYKTVFNIVGRRAKGLLSISNFSRDELVACCGIKQGKIAVVYPGADHLTDNADSESPSTKVSTASNRPFILGVSSMSPHKNFRALVEAVTLLGDTDFDVIIVGGSNPAIFKKSKIPLPETVKYVGYVSDDELTSLYSRAACFIYPSLYEGFGLPPLEAMASGCPVIVAQAGSLPEVCGDAALYCDPQNPQDIADKIKIMMSDVNLRDKFREKGLERAKMFTWEKCAQETLSLIEKVLAQ